MFYAVARIQNPRGMWDYAVAFVKGRFKKKRHINEQGYLENFHIMQNLK